VLFFVIKQVKSPADAMPTDAIKANADPANSFFMSSSHKTSHKGFCPCRRSAAKRGYLDNFARFDA
jgi:hypothetical protein